MPENKITIAILITCFNRKEQTLSCLQRLRAQTLPENTLYEVILVDDGSTDGTSDAISEKYPDVMIVRSGGNLYWNQGMRLAWKTAMDNCSYDYYLLLNDDTDLYDDAIKRLLETEAQARNKSGKSAVAIGSIADSVDGHQTYGGVVRSKNYFGFRFSQLEPGDETKICDTFNANCVLISNEIVSEVGILSDRFTHGLGDYDYGLRAGECGFQCLIAPGYIGSCERNQEANTWRDPQLSFNKRKQLMYSAKGTPPDEWLYFVKRHAGMMWVVLWIQLNARVSFPGLWKILRRFRGRKG